MLISALNYTTCHYVNIGKLHRFFIYIFIIFNDLFKVNLFNIKNKCFSTNRYWIIKISVIKNNLKFILSEIVLIR